MLLICLLTDFGAKINTNTKNELATPPIKTMLMMSTTRRYHGVKRIKYFKLNNIVYFQ
jgi:hypothetical protein